MIFVSALLLGPRTGMAAGGLGSAIADLVGGYSHWAPFTLVIKGIKGGIVGWLFRRAEWGPVGTMWAGVCALLGGLWMVGGYFLVETMVYGWQPALVALPGNLFQAGGSLVAGVSAAAALARAGFPGRAWRET